jgi:cobyrinic acid a,c-diamide synthase
MVGLDACRELLWRAAGNADLILVEGVMGLFDGKPSAADLAMEFDLPVLAVIDARAMAQTFGAVAYGLAGFRPKLKFSGVLANRVAGDNHAKLLKESIDESMTWYGYLKRGGEFELPSRHLGLVQAEELGDIDRRLDLAAMELEGQEVRALPPEVTFKPVTSPIVPLALKSRTIAVAKDEAFGFIYRANLDLLAQMGAEIVFFSPLRDKRLPKCQALYLPGGYPELHLETLSENVGLIKDIQDHQASGRPILAECGGLLYLLKSLGYQGRELNMAGLLPGRASLTGGLRGLGLMRADLPEGTLRGHSFHHSELEMDLSPALYGIRQDGRPKPGEPVYRVGRLTATYIHFYLPSNPQAAAALFTS